MIFIFLAILGGFMAGLWQNSGHLADHGINLQIVQYWTQGIGDPRIFEVTRHGYYYLFNNLVGMCLRGVRWGNPTSLIEGFNGLMWIAQLALCYRIALKLSGRMFTAFFATILYGFGMTLTDHVDSFSYLTAAWTRSAGLTGTLAALSLYFDNRKFLAYAVAVLTLYVHASPIVAVLAFFVLMDGFDLKRWALLAFSSIPLVCYEVGQGHFPAKYADIALKSIGSDQAPFPYGNAVELRALCALLLLAFAYRIYWKGARLECWFETTAVLVGFGALVRWAPWIPPHGFLVQMTAGTLMAWPLEFLGRIVLADAAIQSVPFVAAILSLCAWNIQPEWNTADEQPVTANESNTSILLANCGTAALPLLESIQ